ncbi:presenilins-associated rhomboid-like protein, mitochondrial [Convolutriloba macropyga]|uniref:presenilins-associated rhomboid-like protein, mitochondrial n=1 Tax=Convolutriloba macropyga TaxID=536237 RepID=UPI003F51BF45
MSNLFVTGPRFSVFAIPLAMFSHIGGLHFLINNYVLINASNVCAKSLSPDQFLELYLETGILTNFFMVAFKTLAGSYTYAAVGASAAIYGLFGYLSQAEPQLEVGFILISDMIPQLRFKLKSLPLMVCAFEGFLLIAKYSKTAMKRNPIAHEAHILGMILGILYYMALDYSHKHPVK